MGVAGIVGGIGAIGSLASAGNAIFGGGDSATTTSQSGPPAWLQQYYQQATQRANQVGSQPLNQYQGNMVAGFSPMQLQAFQATEGAQGAANPYINSAAQYFANGSKPINVPGGFSNGQLTGLANQGLGYSNQAANTNIGAGAYPGLAGANRGVAQAQQAAGMGAPQNYAGNVSQYMSPYTQNVVNATQNQFNNQNAQQQQGVIGNAISSGAWGGDRASVAQGITAGQQQLAQAPVIAGLENQGYTNAQSQLNAQQQLGLNAGSLAASTGIQQANLGQSAQAQQAALAQQAAQQQLGFYSGQQQAGIGAQEATGWMGLNAAQGFGALGQQAQSSALTNAQALYSMGSQQQALQQQQLNIPYEQFQQQQAYPFQVAGWQANIDEGLGSSAGGTSSTTSPGPSAFGQAVGGLTSAAGYAGNAGWFGGGASPVSGYQQPYMQASGTLNPVGNFTSPPAWPSNRGGRIPRADGGALAQGLGGTGGSFGMFAQPMASSGVFGSMPKQQMASGGKPVSDVASSFTSNRGISIPLLTDPGSLQRSPDVAANLKKDYAPPPVSSAPFTSTSFPSLTGGTGLPSTESVKPILGLDGKTWVDPRVFDKPTATGTPTNITQAYQDYLGRAPDPGGLAFWSGMPLSQALSGIQDSTEAQQYAGGHASGGAVGFRSGYDDGGSIGMGGPLASGAPIAGGNPIATGMYSQMAQMSPEQLQELAVKMPANSPQGQMVRHALQMAHSAPSISVQTAAYGGRLGFADGGAPDVADIFSDADTDVPSAFSDIIGNANKVPGIAPTDSKKTIFDLIGGPSTMGVTGFSPSPDKNTVAKAGSPLAKILDADPDKTVVGPDGTEYGPQFTRSPGGNGLPAPSGFGGHGAPPPPPAAVPAAAPPSTPTHTASSYVDPGSPDPWKSLIALGGGMLASRSPFASVAIGEGIQNQQKYDESQQAELDKRAQGQSESQWRDKDVDLQAQKLSESLAEHKDNLVNETKRIADAEIAHQDAVRHENAMLGIEGARLEQGKYGAMMPGTQVDPNDPSKTISGVYVLNTKTGQPEFNANVSLTPKGQEAAITVPVRDQAQSQQDYLNSLEPKFRGDVQALIEARSPYPTGMSARSPYSISLVQAAHQADPSMNASEFANRSATAKNFDQGPLANTTRSLSVAVAHTNTLNSLVGALNNGDMKAFNAIGNAWANQTGNPAPGNFDAAKQIVGDELVKAVVGAGGGVGDRDKLQATLDAAKSPAQLQGIISTYQTLMKGQLAGLQQQYVQGTKRSDFLDRLTPEARTALSPPTVPNGMTVVGKTPSGLTVVRDADGNNHVLQ